MRKLILALLLTSCAHRKEYGSDLDVMKLEIVHLSERMARIERDVGLYISSPRDDD